MSENYVDKLTAVSESEMQLFRFLLDRPAGAIFTAETDIMIARLLARECLVATEDVHVDGDPDEGTKTWIPDDVRSAYNASWSDELTLLWRKRNWMYKCLDACHYLYGVMTWGVLANLFELRYPHASMSEVKDLFSATNEFYQWFAEREGRLVMNGYEQDDYYKYLENEIQGDTPFYIPSKEEVEELFDRGCNLSLESHKNMMEFIAKTYEVDDSTAEFKIHELYESINDRVRVNDAADAFAAGEEGRFAFPDDEAHVKFIELYLEMSRDARVRDNRGHNFYEMAAIMADKTAKTSSGARDASVRRAKVGRNDPCPCGSGKKYKNCCGRN